MATFRSLATVLSPAVPVMMLALAVLITITPAHAEDCLSQAEARQAVASGKAASLSLLRSALPGEIVSAALCPGEQGLVYRVSVLRADGTVERITIDARSGAAITP